MAWTDDRVEVLKKLWADGLSASQIAKQLGGVTRNAVIGKVHRLGLSGRATTSRMKSIRPRKRATTSRRAPRLRYGAGAATGAKTFAIEDGDPGYVSTVEELVIPLEERAYIMDLNEHTCRWPIGDPQHEDFHYCGKGKVEGTPYCEHHAQVAFQPPQSRRRAKSA